MRTLISKTPPEGFCNASIPQPAAPLGAGSRQPPSPGLSRGAAGGFSSGAAGRVSPFAASARRARRHRPPRPAPPQARREPRGVAPAPALGLRPRPRPSPWRPRGRGGRGRQGAPQGRGRLRAAPGAARRAAPWAAPCARAKRCGRRPAAARSGGEQVGTGAGGFGLPVKQPGGGSGPRQGTPCPAAGRASSGAGAPRCGPTLTCLQLA